MAPAAGGRCASRVAGRGRGRAMGHRPGCRTHRAGPRGGAAMADRHDGTASLRCVDPADGVAETIARPGLCLAQGQGRAAGPGAEAGIHDRRVDPRASCRGGPQGGSTGRAAGLAASDSRAPAAASIPWDRAQCRCLARVGACGAHRRWPCSVSAWAWNRDGSASRRWCGGIRQRKRPDRGRALQSSDPRRHQAAWVGSQSIRVSIRTRR